MQMEVYERVAGHSSLRYLWNGPPTNQKAVIDLQGCSPSADGNGTLSHRAAEPLLFHAIVALFAFLHAEVAKLADAPDLGSGSERIRGSSPLLGNQLKTKYLFPKVDDRFGSHGKGALPVRGARFHFRDGPK